MIYAYIAGGAVILGIFFKLYLLMKKEYNEMKEPCPTFPFFGARYPDATCIDGYLWDLDSSDDGGLTRGGEDPCPFCNKEEYVQRLRDSEFPEDGIEKHINYLNEKYN